MEILPFLRLTGRRVVGLAVIGTMAGTAAALVVSQQPRQFEASATAFVGQALPDGASTFDLGPLVADFQAATKLDSVLDTAADSLLLSRQDVSVVTARNGDGSSVKVTAVAKDAETAVLIARTTSFEALRFVANRQVDRTKVQETQRKSELSSAKLIIDKLNAENGFTNPVSDYEQVQRQITELRLRAEDPGVTLTESVRQQLVAQAKKLQDSLPQLAAKAEAFRSAQASVTEADLRVQATVAARLKAEATLTGVTNPNAVAVGEATPLSATPDLVRAFGSAMAASFALGVGYFALQDRSRRPAFTPAAPAAANHVVPAHPSPLATELPHRRTYETVASLADTPEVFDDAAEIAEPNDGDALRGEDYLEDELVEMVDSEEFISDGEDESTNEFVENDSADDRNADDDLTAEADDSTDSIRSTAGPDGDSTDVEASAEDGDDAEIEDDSVSGAAPSTLWERRGGARRTARSVTSAASKSRRR